MLDEIIDRNVLFLQNHGVKIESDDDKALYKYGLQILYCNIIDLSLILSIAYIAGRLYETAIMVAIFGLLQVFGGGYHAKTAKKCFLWMAIGTIVGNLMIVLLISNSIVTLALAGVALLIAFLLVPQTNVKHPISRRARERSLWIARVTLVGLLVGMLILFALGMKRELTIIAVTLCLYTVSIASAKIKNANL